MKEGREGKGNSLFQYLILEPAHLYFADVDFRTQNKHTYPLWTAISVLKSLFFYFKMKPTLAYFI